MSCLNHSFLSSFQLRGGHNVKKKHALKNCNWWLKSILNNTERKTMGTLDSKARIQLYWFTSIFPWTHLHLHNSVHGRSADLQLHLFVLQSFLQPHFTRSRQLRATSAIVIQTGCHWFAFFYPPNKETAGKEAWVSPKYQFDTHFVLYAGSVHF